MKKNCQLYTAEDLFNAIYSNPIALPKECWIDKDGNLHSTYSDASKGKLTPNECATAINMPLWEVVMVDGGGFDDYALFFYET